MLTIQPKPIDELLPLVEGNTILISCEGCKEISVPRADPHPPLQPHNHESATVGDDGNRTVGAEHPESAIQTIISARGVITTDYICDPDNLKLQLSMHPDLVAAADTILVYSCGVGVQTVAAMFPEKNTYAVCDTMQLPGWQGVTPTEYDCDRCGQCYLNVTGGVCPITSCSKSLINGQCGGSKNGKCEADQEMDCGWELINRRLNELGLPGDRSARSIIRDYNN